MNRVPGASRPRGRIVDPYAAGWAAIGAAGIGYDIALVASGRPDRTLSAYLRYALGLNPRQPWASAGASALVVALIWAGLHIGFGILPRK
ncbi:MAG: hypothetical protein ACRDRL_33795 [Sciscionella sp.]